MSSSKCLKTMCNSPGHSVELTQKLSTETTAPQSWYSYAITIASHYYAAVTEGL